MGLHEVSHDSADVHRVQLLLSTTTELGKLSQVIAGHGLRSVVGRREAVVHDFVDQVQVVNLLLKEDGVLLPELLSVARTPLELLPIDLVLELLERRVLLLVFFEELSEILEHSGEVRIDPVAVAKLLYESQSVYVAHVLLAALKVFEVVHEHQEDPHDLLLVVEVKDLRSLLQDLQLEVLKVFLCLLVVRQDPQKADDLVGHLSVFCALILQEIGHPGHVTVVHELVGQLILLADGHQSKCVGGGTKNRLSLSSDKEIEEVLRWFGSKGVLDLVKVYLFNQNREGVACNVSVSHQLVAISILHQEVRQDLEHVQRRVEVVNQLDELGGSTSVVFQHAVKLSKSIQNKLIVALDLLNDGEQNPEELGVGLSKAWIVEDLPLLILSRVEETLHQLCGFFWQKSLILEVSNRLGIGIWSLGSELNPLQSSFLPAIGKPGAVHDDLINHFISRFGLRGF